MAGFLEGLPMFWKVYLCSVGVICLAMCIAYIARYVCLSERCLHVSFGIFVGGCIALFLAVIIGGIALSYFWCGVATGVACALRRILDKCEWTRLEWPNFREGYFFRNNSVVVICIVLTGVVGGALWPVTLVFAVLVSC